MPSQSFKNFMKVMEEEREVREKYSQSLKRIRLMMSAFDNRYPLAEDVQVEPVDNAPIGGEWIRVPESRAERVILYIHGGCYIAGSHVTVRECCSRIARASEATVFSLDYRLAPEHAAPAALDDVIAAYRWLLASGYDPKNIVISGESAGGGLTIAALTRLRDSGELPSPSAGIPISPWIDMTLSHKSLKTNIGRDFASVVPLEIGAQLYVADGDPKHPDVSPLYGELGGIPPLLIQVGGAEVLLDDGLAIAHKARMDGVDVTLQVWPDMVHVWHWFGSEFDEARDAIEAIGAFVKSRLQ